MKLRSCETKSLARAHAEFHSPKVLAASAFQIVGMFAPVLAVAVIALFGLSAYADAGVAHSGHHIATTTFAMAGLVGGKSNITGLRQRKADLTVKQRGILDAAAKEARDLTEPEACQFEDNIKALVKIEESIVREEQVLQLERGIVGGIDPNTDPAAQDQGFKSLGEMLTAVVKAERSGGRMVDQRLIPQAAASGTGESVPADGGFLVQQDFSNQLLQKSYDTGILARKVSRIPISAGSNGTKLPAIDETSRATGSRWGGVQVFWAAEADAATAKKPKFRRIELELKKLIGLCYATDEILQDAATLEAVINKAFPEEFGFVLDDSIIRGTGQGQPLGFLNGPCLVTQAAEGGQTATTVNATNVSKMFARMPARLLPNAEWFINQDVFPQLPLMTIGQQPIFVPPNGFAGAPLGTLLGKPINIIEQCESLGTVGDILFANLGEYVLIDKGGIVPAVSMHVRFLNDEQTFRWTYRVDGQPAWNSALTPYKGSNTLSPFVALAAR